MCRSQRSARMKRRSHTLLRTESSSKQERFGLRMLFMKVSDVKLFEAMDGLTASSNPYDMCSYIYSQLYVQRHMY